MTLEATIVLVGYIAACGCVIDEFNCRKWWQVLLAIAVGAPLLLLTPLFILVGIAILAN